MPDRSYKTCSYPGCYELTKSNRCIKHIKNDGSAAPFYDRYKRDKENRSFYTSGAWENCRRAILIRDNYLCQECLHDGILSVATTVHHVKHLKLNKKLALDADNLVSVCTSCHNRKHRGNISG